MPVNDYDDIFQQAAREWNVDPTLLKAVAQQETGGQPGLTSRAGAQGLMQIMPDTQKALGVTDPGDPAQSIFGAAKYLSQLLDRFKTPEAALAAYNAGPGKIDGVISGSAQLPSETAAYVPAVAAHYQKFAAAPSASSGGDLNAVMTRLRAGQQGSADLGGMSDTDFLKATGGPGSVQPEADADFLARTGGKPPAPPAPAAPPEAPSLQSADSPKAQVADRLAGAAVQGAQEGFGSGPLGLGQPAVNALQQAGIYPPANGGGTLLQQANQAVINPLAAGGDLALRSLSALGRGGQALVAQGGVELGQPQLGRDLAAMPEAFMGSGGTGVPRPPNPLAVPAEPPLLSSEFRAAPFTPGANITARPPPDNPLVADAAPAPAPSAAGAAATPTFLTAMAPREAAASRATGEVQNLLQPAKPGIDTTQYVPGVQPTEAEVAGNAATSLRQKANTQQNPEPYRIQQAANNEARVQHFEEVAGTPTIVDRMAEARSAQAQKDLQTAFGAKQPTDAQPVVDTINQILNDPRDSENTAVQKYVAPLLDRMAKDDGTLKSDPEQLYGIREDVNRMLSKTASAETPTLRHVSGQLQAIKGALDGVIEQGAPGYQQYLQNFATASRPIDEMQALQDYRPKLTDANGNMTLGRFNSMMKDIVSDRQAGGVNQAKSINDDTMQRLFNIQADLKRMGNLNLGKPAGSDTFSNFLEAAKQGAAHAAAASIPVPGANLLAHYGLNKLAERKVRSTTQNMLSPDPSKYPPALP